MPKTKKLTSLFLALSIATSTLTPCCKAKKNPGNMNPAKAAVYLVLGYYTGKFSIAMGAASLIMFSSIIPAFSGQQLSAPAEFALSANNLDNATPGERGTVLLFSSLFSSSLSAISGYAAYKFLKNGFANLNIKSDDKK